MSEPYYQDDAGRTCECGCGTPVRCRFVSGHVDGLIRDGHIIFDRDSGEYRRA